MEQSSRTSSKRGYEDDYDRKEKHRKREKKEKKEKKHKKEKKSKSHEKHGHRPMKNETISQHDYYTKAPEFRIWLLESRNTFIEDLETRDARRMFDTFADEWNAGKLRDKYYKGITPETQESSQRTKYKWSFVKNLDPVAMGTLRDAVDKETNYRSKSGLVNNNDNSTVSQDIIHPRLGPTPLRDNTDAQVEEEERQVYGKWKNKVEEKKWKKHKEMIDEELVPKATGREAMIEKKKQKAAYTKGGKDKDNDVELRDDQLYGGSDFHRRVQQQRERESAKMQQAREVQDQKLEEYRRKEAEKLAPFLSLIKSGQVPLMQQQQQPPK